MKSPTTKRPLGRIIQDGEIDPVTARIVFASIGLEATKKAAQKLRERLDWKFDADAKKIYDAALEVVRYVEPKWDTEFVPSL